MVGAAYFRFSPELSKDVPLDETRSDQLIQMLWETKAYIHSNRGDFKKIAELLKAWVACYLSVCFQISSQHQFLSEWDCTVLSLSCYHF